MTEEYLNRALLLKSKIKDSESLFNTINDMSENTDLSIRYKYKNGFEKTVLFGNINKRMLSYIKRICKQDFENLKEEFNQL